MEAVENEIFEDNAKENLTTREQLFKYLSYFPLFLVSLSICLTAGWFYIRYATPKYNITAYILVKTNQINGSSSNSSSEDLLTNALNSGSKINLDNELQLIRSRGLMERVIAKHQFNISYYHKVGLKKTAVYRDAPFRLISGDSINKNTTFTIKLKSITDSGVKMEVEPEGKTKIQDIKWNTSFKINGSSFFFVSSGYLQNAGEYLVSWRPVEETADEILEELTADIVNKKTTIIQLDLISENINRGQEILNALSKEYNLSDIEEKNSVAENTIRFIDDRLGVISRELSGVEGNLENFQGRNQIINVESQSSQSFENENQTSKDLTSINIQQRVVSMIRGYFNNPDNQDQLVPSSLGINDATLSSLISRYNELQLRKQREAPLLAPNSLVLKDINNQINNLKGSVIENLQNISSNLNLQQNSIQQKNVEYRQFLSSLPRKERALQEIRRKQSITEGLYLYLLQKREEAAISISSSNVSSYKQIDPAKAYGPVQPKKRLIAILSILMGLLFPFAWVKMKDRIDSRLISSQQALLKTQIPILGEVNNIEKGKISNIAVLKSDCLGEQFRSIRTNISFFLRNKPKQVLLVASTSANDGKSLISFNLAAAYAITGATVALLEFNMRKPSLTKNLNVNSSKGISNYLLGQTDNLSEIYQLFSNLPNLHLYPSGCVAVNPADLLLNLNLKKLFLQLKTQYDYIIVDSPALDSVTDAFLLSEYSQVVIYVIRLRYSLAKDLEFINTIYRTRKLINIGFVVNDVKVRHT